VQRWTKYIAIGLSASTAAIGLAAISAGATSAGAARLSGSRASFATAANQPRHVAGNRQVTFEVYLGLRNASDAAALGAQVSDPSSALYHHYLTHNDFVSRYAPTQASVDAVKSWLVKSGFKTGYVPGNRFYVEAQGTAAQAEAAFGTTLNDYTVAGKTVQAAATDLAVPAALAGVVSGVVGLDDTSALIHPDNISSDASANASSAAVSPNGTIPQPPGFRNSQPCSAYFGQLSDTTDPAYGGGFNSPLPYAPCGYTPAQFRMAYGVDGAVANGNDGTGQTVAIIDAYASPTLYADAAEYASKNDPTHPLQASQYSSYVAPGFTHVNACGASGWFGEQTLDVEAVHAMAPGANIVYVGGQSCFNKDLADALLFVVDNGVAQIVTNSYGNLGEAVGQGDINAYNEILTEAVLSGIGVYFSSGDSGDEYQNYGFPDPDFPASHPLVTAVGGTSTAIGKDGLKYTTGWETGRSILSSGTYNPPAPGSFLYGAGGGTSFLFAQPGYQKGVVPDKIATRNGPQPARAVPDVAMDGDPNTGMLIGETQTFPDGVYYDQYRIGGTSLASPLFAGFMALSDQHAGFHHGFANPILYSVYKNNPKAYNDVITFATPRADVRVDYINGVDATNGLRTSVRTFGYTGTVSACGPSGCTTENISIHAAGGWDNVTGLGTPTRRLLAGLG
jgi:subtilase family serine protease